MANVQPLIELTAALAELALGDSAPVLGADAASSANLKPLLPATAPPFLNAAFVAAACRDAYLPDDVTAVAVAAAQRMAAWPALCALAEHCRRLLYPPPDTPAFPSERIWRWPALSGPLQAHGGLFYLLVLLAGMPALRAVYHTHAVPEAVARDTLYDIQRRLDEYRAQHGAWGLTPRHLTWLRNHLTGSIYHLVRLQFAPGAFRGGVYVFRHRATQRVIALSEDGVRYRADGEIDGAGGVHDERGGWTAQLRQTDGAIAGSPVLPTGRARRQALRLPAAEWEPVLVPGDPVLHIHIPAGSPMDFARCGQSLRAALAFFPRHFPDRPFTGFACSSWLLDPRFETLLPPSSNIVRFQREVYLLPSRADGRNTLARVFGAVPDDLTTAPRDTALRRAILNHLLAGGHLSAGRCFLLPEDLRWGEQVYRRTLAAMRPAAAKDASQYGRGLPFDAQRPDAYDLFD
jgi:hypothetical protein